MPIFTKTLKLVLRPVFDAVVMGSIAEGVVKDGAKALGPMGGEVFSKILGEWVKKGTEGISTTLSTRQVPALARS